MFCREILIYILLIKDQINTYPWKHQLRDKDISYFYDIESGKFLDHINFEINSYYEDEIEYIIECQYMIGKL